MPTLIGYTSAALMLCTAAATPAVAQDSWLEIEADTADLRFTVHGQDLVYKGGNLYLLRPRENGWAKIWRGSDGALYATSASDCMSSPPVDGLCEDSDCLTFTCFDCTFYPKDGDEPSNTSTVRRFTDGVAIDVLAGGDFVITPSEGALGLYRNTLGNLYTVCSGSDGGVGKQEDNVGIGEYGVAGGTDSNFFSLSYGNGPGLTNGVVVGSINHGVARSRRGSGSGQGGSGGGGPYPGVDSNWSITENIGEFSIGRDNAVGDFNLDGWDDLVVLHPRENTFSILPFLELSDYVSKESGDLIPGGAIFGDPISPDSGIIGPKFAESGDFNGDGILDLVVCGSSGSHHFYKGTETGELEEWATLSSPAGPLTAMTSTDLDGDGRDELVGIGAAGGHDSSVWIQVFRANLLEDFLVEHLDIPEASGTPHTIEARIDSGDCAILTSSHADERSLHVWTVHDPTEDLNSRCGSRRSGDCLQPNGTPGCWDTACCDIVCSTDPHCCFQQWDQNCADLASACDLPLECGAVSAGPCNIANGTPYCDDSSCCQNVCNNRPECCEVEWDDICVVFGQLFGCTSEEEEEAEIWEAVPAEFADADPSLIACGPNHVLMLENGEVRSYGDNWNKRLDMPWFPNRDMLQVEHIDIAEKSALGIDTDGRLVSQFFILGPDDEVTDVARGIGFEMALDQDGVVHAWGSNSWGQTDVPKDIQGNVMHIAAGDHHALAQLTDGSIVAWGRNDFGQCDVPVNIEFPATGVFAGNHVSFASDDNQQLIAWGDMKDPISSVPPGLQGPFADIRIGSGHCAALLDAPGAEAYELQCWGNNNRGQCVVPSASQGRVVRVALGAEHTIVLLDDGDLDVWGSENNYPDKLISPNNPIIEVAADGDNCIAVLADGRVAGWPEAVGRKLATPIRSIAVTSLHSFYVGADGRVEVCGESYPSGYDMMMPADITGPAVKVSTSLNGVAVLLENGEVRSWADLDDVQPNGLDNAIDVAVYSNKGIALTETGELVPLGNNEIFIPDSIQGRVLRFDANADRGMALLDDGSIVSWANGNVVCWAAPGEIGEIAVLDARYILETDGTVHAIDIPGGSTAVPANCSAIGYTEGSGANQYVMAMGRLATSEVHVVNLDLEPLSSSVADLNGDDVVDGEDLGLVLGYWGNPGGVADINQDGIVNGVDMGLLLAAWGPVQ